MRTVIQRPSFTPTGEQQLILDSFRSGHDLAIEAMAGTGKTSSLLLCANHGQDRGVYLAFNRALKEEAQAKFPDTVKVATTHGYAFGAVGRQFAHRLKGARQPWAECARLLKLKNAVQLRNGDLVLKPGSLARLTADMVNRFCYSADTVIGLEHMPYDDKFNPEERTQLAVLLLPYAQTYWEDAQNPNGVLRYSHDHYLKAWALRQPRLDAAYLLVDEFQDTNPCVFDAVNRQTHLQRIVVGDPYQALYGWRGAVDALSRFNVATRLPLTLSFRFGNSIAEIANLFLEQMGAIHLLRGNPERNSSVCDLSEPQAILTRTNAAAVEALLDALEDQLEVALVGGATNVLSFVEAAEILKQGGSTRHPDLSLFSTWDAVMDHVEADPVSEFSMLVRLFQTHGGATLSKALRTTVSEAAADLTISTTHKAKGREFSTVRLSRDLLARVITELYRHDPDALANENPAEQRLRYVAVTRAEHKLDLGPMQSVKRFEKALAEAGLAVTT